MCGFTVGDWGWFMCSEVVSPNEFLLEQVVVYIHVASFIEICTQNTDFYYIWLFRRQISGISLTKMPVVIWVAGVAVSYL